METTGTTLQVKKRTVCRVGLPQLTKNKKKRKNPLRREVLRHLSGIRTVWTPHHLLRGRKGK